eukprot:9232326-Heterocapsa_arctica.AAC.1
MARSRGVEDDRCTGVGQQMFNGSDGREYEFMDKDHNDERVRPDRNDLKFDDNENSTRACRSIEKQTVKRNMSIHLVKDVYTKHICCGPESTKLTKQSGHDSQIDEGRHDNYVYRSHF